MSEDGAGVCGGTREFVKVAVVSAPTATVTVAVPALRLLPANDVLGEVLTDVSSVPEGKVSVIPTGPAGATSAALHELPGVAPAATVTEVPPTLNVKFVPAAMPGPATLHIWTVPVVPVLMKVAMVSAPAVTVTVAVPAPRLLLASAPGGEVLTDVSSVPEGKVSVIPTGPAGATSAALHELPGVAPAATITEVPPTLNVKFVPAAMPAPATLQTWIVPAVPVLVKVAVVNAPPVTVTVAMPAARLLLTSAPGGEVLTEVRKVLEGRVSVIPTGPTGATSAALHELPGVAPAGTTTTVPPTLNVKFVPAATPELATLQTRMVPVVPVLVKVAVVCAPAVTVTVAIPAARLLLTRAPGGEVLTEVSKVPEGRVSVITA